MTEEQKIKILETVTGFDITVINEYVKSLNITLGDLTLKDIYGNDMKKKLNILSKKMKLQKLISNSKK